MNIAQSKQERAQKFILHCKKPYAIFIVFFISTVFFLSQSSLTGVYFNHNEHELYKTTSMLDELSQDESEESKIKVNISGIWESNIGWKYNIKQKGKDFTWTVINRNQTASGTIDENNKDIEAEWIDNGSKGTSKGLILEVDENGKATFIEWDNGVFFHRE